jgi:hypothetical protein
LRFITGGAAVIGGVFLAELTLHVLVGRGEGIGVIHDPPKLLVQVVRQGLPAGALVKRAAHQVFRDLLVL